MENLGFCRVTGCKIHIHRSQMHFSTNETNKNVIKNKSCIIERKKVPKNKFKKIYKVFHKENHTTLLKGIKICFLGLCLKQLDGE